MYVKLSSVEIGHILVKRSSFHLERRMVLMVMMFLLFFVVFTTMFMLVMAVLVVLMVQDKLLPMPFTKFGTA